MTDIEETTRRLAAEVGAGQGRHPVDGADLVSLAAGWVARTCAEAADLGGQLPEMTFRLADAMEGEADATRQRLAGALAKICFEVAERHPEAPGDAIRDAFLWTGWCHSTFHGEAVLVHPRLQGPGRPKDIERARLEREFLAALLDRLVTDEAVHAAYYGDNRWPSRTSAGARSYWERKWKAARAEAMVQVFPEGLPTQTTLRIRFSSSPW